MRQPALIARPEVLVIQTANRRDNAGEIRVTVKPYFNGKIRQWYSRGDGKGVIFLVDAKTVDEARALMETLPLAKEDLMDHQYIPVGPFDAAEGIDGPWSPTMTLVAEAGNGLCERSQQYGSF